MIKKMVLVISVFSIMYSCAHVPQIPVSPVVSYSKQVQAVIIANCTMSGCHDGNRGELFSLLTYNDLMQRNLIVPGNAKSSRLYTAINGSSGDNAMPPAGQMSNDDILLIYLWIAQGAKNN